MVNQVDYKYVYEEGEKKTVQAPNSQKGMAIN